MRTLITGATGFVGSHVARQLLDAGHVVRLLVRDQSKAQKLLIDLGVAVDSEKCELLVGDITNAQQMESAVAGCTALVHAAAGTPIALPSKDELFAVNVGGTKNIVGAAVKAGLNSIVHISSATAVFNADASKIDLDAPLLMPDMPYGRSKVEAENYVREQQAAGAPVSIVYPSGIFGPDDPGFSDTFKALCHRIHNGFRLFDNGGMQQVDVRDLAAFVASLALNGESSESNGRHLVVGNYLSWVEQADLIEQVSGATLERIPAKGWKMRLIGRMMDVIRMVKTVDTPISAETMRYATQWPKMQNSSEIKSRGIAFRDPAESYIDSLTGLLNAGYLKPEQVPRLAVKQ